MTSTIDAAETTLPELLNNLQAGDTVILTSGEGKTPIAKVEAIPPPVANPHPRLGLVRSFARGRVAPVERRRS
jgi:antitoxin (DNA-binding transcriptional repressor) of toxin-antitoxin stability system